jgi:hypothetical protein
LTPGDPEIRLKMDTCSTLSAPLSACIWTSSSMSATKLSSHPAPQDEQRKWAGNSVEYIFLLLGGQGSILQNYISAEYFSAKYFSAKYFSAKYFLDKYFSDKYFLDKYFFG